MQCEASNGATVTGFLAKMPTWMLSAGRSTLPVSSSCGTTLRTVSMPIAKPTPADVPDAVKMAAMVATSKSQTRAPKEPAISLRNRLCVNREGVGMQEGMPELCKQEHRSG